MAEASSGLRTLLAALPQRRKRQLALLTLLALVAAAAELLFVGGALLFLAALARQPVPAALAAIVPVDSGPIPVVAAAALFAGTAVFTNVVRMANLGATERFTSSVSHELTVDVQQRVLAQPFAYHSFHHSSEVIASLEKVQLVASSLINQWLQGVAALATGLAIFMLVGAIDLLPALAAFAVLGLFYAAIARLAAARLSANSGALGRAYEDRIRNVQDSLGAIRDLKLDHSEAAQLDDFRRVDARYASSHASTSVIIAAPRFLVEAGAVALVAALAAFAAQGSGEALLLVAGVAVGGLRLLPLVQTAYRSWATVRGNRAMIDDVVGLLSLPLPAEAENAGPPLPFRDAIRLADVSFRYSGRDEPAVDRVTVDIRRGDRIAFAGETGSGKSTLMDLIMGLLAPNSGEISVDDVRLDLANVRAWQRNIAHVAQAIFLADASIARNIAFSRPGEPVDMERVREAARAAELLEFVETLPKGFDTAVGERGVRLSGGQRQRIGIARALYKGAPVLVLDEATNALDEGTEARVLANILADKERTVIMVAHRTAAIAQCDRVIRLCEGRVESGG